MGLGVLLVAVAGVAIAVAQLLLQVQVTDAGSGVTRACGSAFDSVADRSGWQQWWAQDLDEVDAVRPALVRTTQCPAAVNRRIVVAAVAGSAGLVAGGVAVGRRLRRGARRDGGRAPDAARRMSRLGLAATAVGGALTALGVVAIVVLVADADSTLFLYTDRLVVGVVGLIVLIPTVTLVVLGRVLAVAADALSVADDAVNEPGADA